MSRRKGRVVCIGTCPAGHVTRATSDEGRTTWNGPCAHEGCEEKVFARRAPRQDQHSVSPEAIVPTGNPGEVTGGAPGHKAGDNPGHKAGPKPNSSAKPKKQAGAGPGKQPGAQSRVVKVEGWADERDDAKPGTRRAAASRRAATGRSSPAAGSGTKAPGRGKRKPGQRAEPTDPAAGGGATGPSPDAAGGGQGRQRQAADEGGPAPGRGRRALARVGAALRAPADDGDDLYDGIY